MGPSECMPVRTGHLQASRAGFSLAPWAQFSWLCTPTFLALSEASLCWTETNGGRFTEAGLMKALETAADVNPHPEWKSGLLLWS
jgi:hypothetical protein